MKSLAKKSTCKDKSADLGGIVTLFCLKAFRPRGFIGILGGYRKNIRGKSTIQKWISNILGGNEINRGIQ